MTDISAVLFTTRRDSLAEFYGAIAGLRRTGGSAEHAVLTGGSSRLVLHDIPAGIAASISVTTPPAVRESSAAKLVFAVPSLARARATATALGGCVYGPDRGFTASSCRSFFRLS